MTSDSDLCDLLAFAYADLHAAFAALHRAARTAAPNSALERDLRVVATAVALEVDVVVAVAERHGVLADVG